MLNFPHKVTDIFVRRWIHYTMNENPRPCKLRFFNIYPGIVSVGHVAAWLGG